MKLSIFEYNDYKKFIHDWMDKTPSGGRGQRKALADAIGCQTPFITHVLSGDYHLSMEQAEACARWLQLEEKEFDFFILLVLRNRAGTKTLVNYFDKQLSERRTQQSVLKKRLKIEDTLSSEAQLVYYSSWHYATVHIALLIPTLRTVEALNDHFKISIPRLIAVLDFLIDNGLIESKKNTYRVLKPLIHLEKDSPLLTQHHTQWRLKAVEEIQAKAPESLHFSGVISLSEADFEWVRERITQLLEQLPQKLKDSADENICCLNFDWFKI